MSVLIDDRGNLTATTFLELMIFGVRVGVNPMHILWGAGRRHPRIRMPQRAIEQMETRGAVRVSARTLAKAAGKIGLRKGKGR
jgi:hypothetical protein